MPRAFKQLRLTLAMCGGLREAIRPLEETSHSPAAVVDFCRRLYLALYSLEADPELGAVDFPVSEDEIMIINNFLSAEDGDWAGQVLAQTRQVLFELTTGSESVLLASDKDVAAALDAVVLPPGKNPPDVV
jgi:hypothetical protein